MNCVCKCFQSFLLGGTYEVTDFKRSYGANVLKAASSATAVAPDEVDNTWKHVKNLNAVSRVEARPFHFVVAGMILRRYNCNINLFCK